MFVQTTAWSIRGRGLSVIRDGTVARHVTKLTQLTYPNLGRVWLETISSGRRVYTTYVASNIQTLEPCPSKQDNMHLKLITCEAQLQLGGGTSSYLLAEASSRAVGLSCNHMW